MIGHRLLHPVAYAKAISRNSKEKAKYLKKVKKDETFIIMHRKNS